MTQQIETATVIGTIVNPGNAKITVTGDYLSTNPEIISVAVLALDDASAIASKMRTALGLDGVITAEYAVSGAAANIILTAHIGKANDSTLNIATDNDTCTGMTAAPTSTNTQAGAGITNGYCTLAELKQFSSARGETASVDANDDSFLETLIEGISRNIDDYCHQIFYHTSTGTEETRYFTAKFADLIFVDPIVSVTSVGSDSTLDRTYATSLSTSEYDLMPINAGLRSDPYTWLQLVSYAHDNDFCVYENGIKIVGVFGWPAVPSQIKTACLEICHQVMMERNGARGYSGDMTNYNIPPSALSILKHKRRIL